MHKGLVFTDAEWLDLPQTYGAQVAEMLIKRFRIIELESGTEVADYWAFARDMVAKHLSLRPVKRIIGGIVFLSEDEWHQYTVRLAYGIAQQIKDTHQFIECEGEGAGLQVRHLDNRLSAILSMATINRLKDCPQLPNTNTNTISAKAERMRVRAERLLMALAEKNGIYLSQEQGFELIEAEDGVDYHAHGSTARPVAESVHLLAGLGFPGNNEDTALKLLEKRNPVCLESIRELLNLDDPTGAVIILASPPNGSKMHVMDLILKDLFERNKSELVSVTHFGEVLRPYPSNAWVKTQERLVDQDVDDPASGYGQVIVISHDYDPNALANAVALAKCGHKVIFTVVAESLNDVSQSILAELNKRRADYRTLHANHRFCMVFQPTSELQYTF